SIAAVAAVPVASAAHQRPVSPFGSNARWYDACWAPLGKSAQSWRGAMCGIMAYVGREAALPIVLDGLRRLEYRGYDSAGIAVLLNGGAAANGRHDGHSSNGHAAGAVGTAG